jgi:diguanylate cyclase (GGDEF)-like protein
LINQDNKLSTYKSIDGMQQKNLEEVLENIVTLTSEKDSNALEIALAQTLFKLVGVKNMVMYSAGNINRAKHAISDAEKLPANEEIEAGIVDSLIQCLKTAKISTIQHQNKKLTLFPLLCSKQKPLAVISVEESQNSNNNDLSVLILKIYHNFLALMNDNERDTLTGLLNRKTFDLKINNIIADLQNLCRRKEDSDEPAYLAIFDIDHFKRVNDTYGHLMGDEVLLLFSHLMNKSFRDEDLLFRFGGEEFVGVFQCPSDEIVESVLNRFREVIEKYQFPQVGQVTVSCGYTKIESDDLSSSIIDRADTALYHAKSNGRNQVCQHEKLVASGLLTKEDTIGGEIELF